MTDLTVVQRGWQTVGRARRGIPLSLSLVVLMLALVLSGLAASGVAVTSAMRSDLMNRVDASLVEATRTWARPMGQDRPPMDRTRGHPPGPRRPPSNFYVQVSSDRYEDFTTSDYEWAPDLSELKPGQAGPVTVDSVGKGPDWRVVQEVSPVATVVVATPLKDVDDTVSRLIWLQAGIGSLVVAVLGVLGYLLVNSSLRPLRKVEETAHAIAGGDLSQRVPELRQGTEVASLGDSINGMLGQIQTAFAATEESEQQARASEERMRRFVADASHELRTPLTSIKGFADLIRGGMTDDPADGVARISSEADRMSLLVEDLLMLARLDSSRPLHKAPVELESLVDDAVAAARASAPGREITVVRDAADGLIVDGDAARLTQVLRNLIGNAITHTPGGTPIRVVLAADGAQARVEVIDDGPGLAADEAAHVFERFYRGDSSRHREGSSGGTGLGLSIVAALVHAHGGTVGVESGSSDLNGARFWFTLPLLGVDRD